MSRRLTIGWGALVTSLVVALGCCAGAIKAFAGESSQYEVEAAYLYKFAPFVDWPSSVFTSAQSPIYLCIVGDDPFGSTIDRFVSGQFDGQRPIEVRRLRRARADSACQIMFVSGSDVQSVAEALDAVAGEPILTATDADSGPSGIIHFVIENQRVRFDIDQDAADESGIIISSKLLSLARSVKRAKG